MQPGRVVLFPMDETNPRPKAGRESLTTRPSLISDVCDPGRRTRWEEFDKTYRRVVLAMARRDGLTYHEAEDLTQEVFAELCESLAGFRRASRPGSFRSFLFRLVHWRAISRYEQLRRRSAISLDDSEARTAEPSTADGNPHEEGDFKDALVRTMQALSKDLSPRDLQILELFYCSEWPAEQVAQRLNTQPAVVYAVAHRQKQRFARELRRQL